MRNRANNRTTATPALEAVLIDTEVAPFAEAVEGVEAAEIELLLDAGGGPTDEEFMSVRDLILTELDQPFFKDRFESATDAEQRHLAVMAELPEAPYRSAEVAGRGYRTASSASEPRAGLMRKDLIEFSRASSPEPDKAR